MNGILLFILNTNKEMIELTINERINALYKNSGERSIRSFAIKVGIAPTTLNECIKGSEPRFSLLNALLNGIPSISAEWLLRGEGEMIKGTSSLNTKDFIGTQTPDSISFYERTIEKKEQKIEELTLMVGRLQHEVEMLQLDKKTALRKDDVLGAAKKTGTNGQ